jgi:hypothetical protein
VSLWRDLVPYFANLAVRPDPESHAHNPQERFPQKTFHPARAVGLDDIKFRVGEQRERKLVFLFEFCLCFHGIAAAADDGGVQLFELLEGVTKLGRFVRSTGCIRFRIKIENQVLPVKILQRNSRATIIGDVKIRRFVAFFEH